MGWPAGFSFPSLVLKFGRAWATLNPDSRPRSLSLSPGTQNVEAQAQEVIYSLPLPRKLCVTVSLASLSPQERRGPGARVGGRGTLLQEYLPPSPFRMASCLHDQEHGHCGGPEAHQGRFVEVTTGEIWVY